MRSRAMPLEAVIRDANAYDGRQAKHLIKALVVRRCARRPPDP